MQVTRSTPCATSWSIRIWPPVRALRIDMTAPCRVWRRALARRARLLLGRRRTGTQVVQDRNRRPRTVARTWLVGGCDLAERQALGCQRSVVAVRKMVADPDRQKRGQLADEIVPRVLRSSAEQIDELVPEAGGRHRLVRAATRRQQGRIEFPAARTREIAADVLEAQRRRRHRRNDVR